MTALHEYQLRVYDPEQSRTVLFGPFRTFNERAAVQEARQGYTGLLGDPDRLERIQDQLEVTVISVDGEEC